MWVRSSCPICHGRTVASEHCPAASAAPRFHAILLIRNAVHTPPPSLPPQRRAKMKHQLGLPEDYGVGPGSSDSGGWRQAACRPLLLLLLLPPPCCCCDQLHASTTACWPPRPGPAVAEAGASDGEGGGAGDAGLAAARGAAVTVYKQGPTTTTVSVVPLNPDPDAR